MEKPLTLTPREAVASTTARHERPSRPLEPDRRPQRHPTHLSTDRTHRKVHAC